ncbi:hypothetical protein [Rhodococcus sp. 077-4]
MSADQPAEDAIVAWAVLIAKAAALDVLTDDDTPPTEIEVTR